MSSILGGSGTRARSSYKALPLIGCQWIEISKGVLEGVNSMAKNTKIVRAESIVSQRLTKIKFQHLRHVIVLTGYNNDGKTSVLKALIAEIYRRNPNGWRAPRKYDSARVEISVEKRNVEYQAIFEYCGVRIAITTAGDASNIVAWNFEYCAKYNVEIGIMAVRVSAGEKKVAAAEYAYRKARSMVSATEHVVDIAGKKIREKERRNVVEQIIGILDGLTKSKKEDGE